MANKQGNAARSYIVLHRKAKDGEQGPPGKDSVLFVITPAALSVACDAKGNPKSGNTSYTLSFRITKGNTDITSKYLPTVAKVKGCVSSVGSGTITIGNFTADTGYANFLVTVDSVDYKCNVPFVKVKDGSDGKSGDTPIILSLSPQNIVIPCDKNGNLKSITEASVTLKLMKGNTDITSSAVWQAAGTYCTATVDSSNTSVTITNFTATSLTGYSGTVLIGTTMNNVTYSDYVKYQKVLDGADGTKGTDGHSYGVTCPSVTIYLYSSGKMKASSQTTQATFYKDGVAQTTGVTWSRTAVSDTFPESASVTINSSGVVTVTGYNTTALSTFTIKGVKDGITQTLTVSVGGIKDGAQGTAGLRGDTMLYKGEWQKTVTYKKHYKLDSTKEEYYSDYVSYGKTSTGMTNYYAATQDNVSQAPMSGSNYWTMFATADYVATKLLITDQLNANIADIVELHAESFYTKTLKATTIDAQNATFNNLTVSGYFRSGFEVKSFESLNVKMTGSDRFSYNGSMSDLSGYMITDKLNLMITKTSNSSKNRGDIYLPNTSKYVGARVLISVVPPYDNTGQYVTEATVQYVNILTGVNQGGTGVPYTYHDSVGWFINTAVKTTSNTITAAAGRIKLWGGFVELIGVPYIEHDNSTDTDITWCRWMLLNMQSIEDVEYFGGFSPSYYTS